MKRKFLLKTDISLFLIVCLLLLTLYITYKTTSKYSKANRGTSSSQIAIWNVNVQNNQNSMEIVAGNGDKTYEITVQSTSEVSCTYSIELSNLPDGILVALDSGTFRTPENGNVVFQNVGAFHFLDGITSRTHEIVFKAELESSEIVNNDVEVNVVFNQTN